MQAVIAYQKGEVPPFLALTNKSSDISSHKGHANPAHRRPSNDFIVGHRVSFQAIEARIRNPYVINAIQRLPETAQMLTLFLTLSKEYCT